MIYYIDNEPISNSELYSDIISIGEKIDSRYIWFIKYEKYSSNIKTDILPDYFDNIIETGKSQNNMNNKEEQLIDFVVNKLKLETDCINKFKKKYSEKNCHNYFSDNTKNILKYCHIVYVIETIIKSLKNKDKFSLSIYLYNNDEEHYYIYKNNMLKKLTKIINYFFKDCKFDITMDKKYNINYIPSTYWTIIKFMLFANLKCIVNNISNCIDISSCSECGYLFLKKRKNQVHFHRKYCENLRNKTRKRNERERKKLL